MRRQAFTTGAIAPYWRDRGLRWSAVGMPHGMAGRLRRS